MISESKTGHHSNTAPAESLLEEIVRRILTVAQPDKIILFGSAATGHMNPTSDIDLLLVSREVDKRWEGVMRVREALRDMDYSFDLIPMSTEWFEGTKEISGGLAYPAHKHGRVLYESGR
jgi:uncharacterized protein